MTSARKRAYLALIGCELIWGASQPLVKPALHFITPAQFLFLRYLCAAPLVIPLIVYGIRQTRFKPKDWLMIIITETMAICNLFILYTGLRYITSLQSSLIVNTRPIFMTIVGIMLLNEHEEGHEWIGLLASIIGTVLFLLSPLLGNGQSLSQFPLVGTLLVVTTNIIYTIVTMMVKKHYQNLNKLAISGIHMWLGVFLFSIYLGIQHQLPSLSLVQIPSVMVAVIYMSLFGSIIALTLSNFGYATIEASEATLFYYLQPLVYVPLALVWLKESISVYQIVGMMLILVGVWWAERRPRKHSSVHHGFPLLSRYQIAETGSAAHPYRHQK